MKRRLILHIIATFVGIVLLAIGAVYLIPHEGIALIVGLIGGMLIGHLVVMNLLYGKK